MRFAPSFKAGKVQLLHNLVHEVVHVSISRSARNTRFSFPNSSFHQPGKKLKKNRLIINETCRIWTLGRLTCNLACSVLGSVSEPSPQTSTCSTENSSGRSAGRSNVSMSSWYVPDSSDDDRDIPNLSEMRAKIFPGFPLIFLP